MLKSTRSASGVTPVNTNELWPSIAVRKRSPVAFDKFEMRLLSALAELSCDSEVLVSIVGVAISTFRCDSCEH